MQKSKPKLYSFRRCPYAIRARLSLIKSKILFENIEIDLKKKSEEFKKISKDATVPVLLINKKNILQESTEIMIWAFEKSKNFNIVNIKKDQQMQLINFTENYFKPNLDKFKYAKKTDIIEKKIAKENSEKFLFQIENFLCKNKYLLHCNPLLCDYAVVPFIRQFFFSDKSYFEKKSFEKTSAWLQDLIDSNLLKKVMKK